MLYTRILGAHLSARRPLPAMHIDMMMDARTCYTLRRAAWVELEMRQFWWNSENTRHRSRKVQKSNELSELTWIYPTRVCCQFFESISCWMCRRLSFAWRPWTWRTMKSRKDRDDRKHKRIQFLLVSQANFVRVSDIHSSIAKFFEQAKHSSSTQVRFRLSVTMDAVTEDWRKFKRHKKFINENFTYFMSLPIEPIWYSLCQVLRILLFRHRNF